MAITERTRVFECSDGKFFGTREEAEKHEEMHRLLLAVEQARLDAEDATRPLRSRALRDDRQHDGKLYRTTYDGAFLASLIRQGVTIKTPTSEE